MFLSPALGCMDRRRFLRTGGSIAGVGLLAGCVGQGPDGDGSDGSGGDGSDGSGGDGSDGDGGGTNGDSGSIDGPVRIGALEPTSGNFTPWGQAHLAGLEFAVEQINADGGVLGAELEVTVEDTGSDPTQATDIFRRMVEQEGINAATGPVSSDVGIQTSQLAQQLSVPLLLHMAGSTKAIEPETRHTFRVGIHPALSFVRAQQQIIEQNGYERIGAVIADYGWGNSVRASIEEVIEADVNVQTASVGASDFRPFIRQFPEDLEMMISTGHPPGTISISTQMAELGYQPELTTGPSFPPAVLWGALGETAVEVNQTHVHITDVYGDRFQEVATAFAEENDARMDTHAGYGYVTGQLIAEAVRQSGSTDPGDITDTIRDIAFETLFAEPLQYADSGEIEGQRQLYSQFETGAPDYYDDGSWRLTEFFRTDPLPAIPAEA